jgi:hypothetical protein
VRIATVTESNPLTEVDGSQKVSVRVVVPHAVSELVCPVRSRLLPHPQADVAPLGSTFGLCTSVPPAFQSWYASWMVWSPTVNRTCQRPTMDELTVLSAEDGESCCIGRD